LNYKSIIDISIAAGFSSSLFYLKGALTYLVKQKKHRSWSGFISFCMNSTKRCERWYEILRTRLQSVISFNYCSRLRLTFKSQCPVLWRHNVCHEGTWDVKNPTPWCNATCIWDIHGWNICQVIRYSEPLRGFSCPFNQMQGLYLKPRPFPSRALLINGPKSWHYIAQVT
jgi:hypothetical protein